MDYAEFVRQRITQLRLERDVSEHRMSFDLDKSGSYIRGITSGKALPSLTELFHIFEYFDMTPAEFFAPLDDENTPKSRIASKIRNMDEESLAKVETFIKWITE